MWSEKTLVINLGHTKTLKWHQPAACRSASTVGVQSPNSPGGTAAAQCSLGQWAIRELTSGLPGELWELRQEDGGGGQDRPVHCGPVQFYQSCVGSSLKKVTEPRTEPTHSRLVFIYIQHMKTCHYRMLLCTELFSREQKGTYDRL